MEQEAERQARIDSLLEEFQDAIDWKFTDDGTIQIMHPRETPLEKAAEKLLKAGWERVESGYDDDPHRRFDWFQFRIPEEPESGS